MKAREPEAAENIPGQHTVTQALLRRFTISMPGNQYALCRIDLAQAPGRGKTKTPSVVGKIENFVPYASASMEKYWSKIEKPFPEAFAALDDRTLFDPGQERALSVVRDAAALHFVRSAAAKRNHFASFDEALTGEKEFWRRRPLDLCRWYYRETGLYVGPGAIEMIIERLLKNQVERVRSGATLREQMENLFERVRTVLEYFAVEIWTPAPGSGEFLIGDAPAVTCDPHSGRVGLAAGVALLGDDVSLVLPLGPGHLARLHRGPETGFREIPADEAEKVNAAQILAAESESFARPGTSFGPFVEKVLKHRCYPFPMEGVAA